MTPLERYLDNWLSWYGIIGLLFQIVTVIGLYFIFKKMNEKTYKAFIPFVGMYTLFNRIWDKKHAILFVVFRSLSWTISQFDIMVPIKEYGLDYEITLYLLFQCTMMIFIIIWSLKLAEKLLVKFHMHRGLTALFLIAEPIMLLVIGLNDRKYTEEKSKTKKSKASVKVAKKQKSNA